MSFRNIQQNNIDPRNAFNAPTHLIADAKQAWIRNPAWPTMPTVLSSENKFVGLYAIFRDSNYISISASTSAGQYNVNWGDGTSTNVNSAAQANYEYNYNSSALDGTDAPVTFTASTNTANRTAHNYQNGNPVSFYNIVTTTGILPGNTYYVINATTDTFQIATTPNGPAITLTNDGSATLLPYKIAIVTLTPVNVGATITALNLRLGHPSTPANQNIPWLEIALSVSASVQIGTSSLLLVNRYLEIVNIVRCTNTSFNDMFRNCSNLKQVTIGQTGVVTNALTMFSGCDSLVNAPMFNTSNITNFGNMFDSCYSLVNVPFYNTSNGTSFSSMFLNCYSLMNVPTFDLGRATTVANMFQTCRSLTDAPALRIGPSCTTFTSMFENCSSLVNIPSYLYDTKNAQFMDRMFYGCSSLITAPMMDTGNVINMSNMFALCVSLENVPLYNTSKVAGSNITNASVASTFSVEGMSSMFQNCFSLKSIPNFDFSKVKTFNSFALGCISLVDVPPIMNTEQGQVFSNMFNGCASLVTAPMILTNSSTNIPITSNSYGFLGAFANCSSLKNVPALDISKHSNRETFSQCRSLEVIPLLTASNYGVSMFADCRTLRECNLDVRYNTDVVGQTSAMSNAFASCFSLSRLTAPGAFNGPLFVQSSMVSVTSTQLLFENVVPNYTQTGGLSITVSGAPAVIGSNIPTTKTGSTLTSGSTVLTLANTTTIRLNDLVTGNGISTAVPVTFQDAGDTVTRLNHGLTNTTRVSFSTITTTTGISTWVPYYVISASTDTFQLSTSSGGVALPLTGDGAGQMLYGTFVTGFTGVNQVTVSAPASISSSTVALTFLPLNTSIATLKRWSVTT